MNRRHKTIFKENNLQAFQPVIVVDHFLLQSWSSPAAEAAPVSSSLMLPIVSLYPHDDRGGGPVKNRGDPPRLHRFNYRPGDAVGVLSLLLTGRGLELRGGQAGRAGRQRGINHALISVVLHKVLTLQPFIRHCWLSCVHGTLTAGSCCYQWYFY